MPNSPSSKKNSIPQKADICLLLEGSYPYIRGGVSSWVHQLIIGHPNYQFALVFIGASRKHYKKMRYELPENVCHLEKHFLNEGLELKEPKPYPLDKALLSDLKTLYQLLADSKPLPPLETFPRINQRFFKDESLKLEGFFYSTEVWDLITESYRKNCPEQSFSDFFWTVRAMYSPILNLLKIAKGVPDAGCYHTISTGYAGVLGMFLEHIHHRPLILSEHGIYTKERQIDLYQANWIKELNRNFKAGLDDHMSYLRQLWMQFFEVLGQLTYGASTVTITLYEQNRLKQIELGAKPENAIVIPNGVKIERFKALRARRGDMIPPVLCLLGRVVPIKDIKTYIHAIGILSKMIPKVEGWIVGPEEEDETYADECHALVKQLKLEQQVKFLGFQNIDDILPKTGLITLSSISEGQPLVILEGFAAGVPTLSTDVGFCRGMVEGESPKDKALGEAGLIVPLANPYALATAAAELLNDEKRWYHAQKNAMARVERFYSEEIFLKNYQALYHKVLNNGWNRV